MLLPFQRGLPTSVLGPEANPVLLLQKELEVRSGFRVTNKVEGSCEEHEPGPEFGAGSE